jgi:hypothetical protein
MIQVAIQDFGMCHLIVSLHSSIFPERRDMIEKPSSVGSKSKENEAQVTTKDVYR